MIAFDSTTSPDAEDYKIGQKFDTMNKNFVYKMGFHPPPHNITPLTIVAPPLVKQQKGLSIPQHRPQSRSPWHIASSRLALNPRELFSDA